MVAKFRIYGLANTIDFQFTELGRRGKSLPQRSEWYRMQISSVILIHFPIREI